MARFFDKLTPDLTGFIRRQPIFFVASACAQGRVNLSPKGMDTFRVLSDSSVAYLDLTGSGNETSAHLLHDGRLTMMFCSFDDKPLIVRLYGRGEVVRPRDAGWVDLMAHFEPITGQRQIIVLRVESVQSSCGFGVPEMALVRPRTILPEHWEKLGPDAVAAYWAKTNVRSIDGLPTKLLEKQTP